MSDFGGLNIALSALMAQRRGLEITGHNVANANTDGYSREAVDLQAIQGALVPGIFARASGSGSGVMVAGYTRFRDQFLEIRAALEHGAQAHLTQVSNALSNLESLFAEPSDQSIGQGLSDFWSGWGDLANNPNDPASRQQLLQRGATLAATFNNAAQQISQQRSDAIAQLGATVDDVNSTAATVAQLNSQIQIAVSSGQNAGDLQDQRDKLVQDLASKIGATVRPGEDGTVNVLVNGTMLVNGNHAQTLQLDVSNPASIAIRWTADNFAANVTGGDAGGYLDVVNAQLPGYAADLDTVAQQLMSDVNSAQSAIGGSIDPSAQDQSASGNLQFQIALNGGGYATATVAGANWSGAGGAAALQTALQSAVDAAIGAGNATVAVSGGNGSPLSVSVVPTGANQLLVQGVSGNAGFTTLLGTTAVGLDGVGGRTFFQGTGAADLAISSAIAGNPNAIAAGASGAGPLDGSVALTMSDLGTSANGADSLYRSFIVGLGVNSQDAQRRLDMQNQTVDQVDGARTSYSSVNTDEEMVNMVQYQHAYEAAARYMTTVDSILNTLINHTGLTA